MHRKHEIHVADQPPLQVLAGALDPRDGDTVNAVFGHAQPHRRKRRIRRTRDNARVHHVTDARLRQRPRAHRRPRRPGPQHSCVLRVLTAHQSCDIEARDDSRRITRDRIGGKQMRDVPLGHHRDRPIERCVGGAGSPTARARSRRRAHRLAPARPGPALGPSRSAARCDRPAREPRHECRARP